MRDCKHDWLKLTNIQKAWYMIFIYMYQKDEKLVCLKCGKEVRP